MCIRDRVGDHGHVALARIAQGRGEGDAGVVFGDIAGGQADAGGVGSVGDRSSSWCWIDGHRNTAATGASNGRADGGWIHIDVFISSDWNCGGASKLTSQDSDSSAVR